MSLFLHSMLDRARRVSATAFGIRQSASGRLRKIYRSIDIDTIDKWDAYIDIYDTLFEPIAHKPVRLLEIGVLRGGSLKMWSEYFPKRSLIVGLDIDPACKAAEANNVMIEIGDQKNKVLLDALAEKYKFFDIVIDDGSHYWCDQISTFKELYDRTTLMYIVEDTHTSYWSKYDGSQSESFVSLVKSRIDNLHEYFIAAGSPDLFGPSNKISPIGTITRFRQDTRSIEIFDSMVVFKKGHNPAPFRQNRLA